MSPLLFSCSYGQNFFCKENKRKRKCVKLIFPCLQMTVLFFARASQSSPSPSPFLTPNFFPWQRTPVLTTLRRKCSSQSVSQLRSCIMQKYDRERGDPFSSFLSRATKVKNTSEKGEKKVNQIGFASLLLPCEKRIERREPRTEGRIGGEEQFSIPRQSNCMADD